MLHLAAQIACLDLEVLDALDSVVRKPVELARVDEHAQREPFAVLLKDALVARHGPAGDLGLCETADSSCQHVDWSSHERHANSVGRVAPVAAGGPARSAPRPAPYAPPQAPRLRPRVAFHTPLAR